MKRYEFEKAVYESDLSNSEKAVLIYYGFRKNWNEDGTVWVSAETVGQGIGYSTRTVETKVPMLKELGWLVDTGERKPNGKGRPSIVYNLAIGLSRSGFGKDTFTETDAGLYRNEQQDFTETVSDEVSKRISKEEQVSNKKEDMTLEETDTVANAPVEPLEDLVTTSPNSLYRQLHEVQCAEGASQTSLEEEGSAMGNTTYRCVEEEDFKYGIEQITDRRTKAEPKELSLEEQKKLAAELDFTFEPVARELVDSW